MSKRMGSLLYGTFDLDAAKTGAPVWTRAGKRVKFIAHLRECRADSKVYALVDGDSEVEAYWENGRLHGDEDSPYDLVTDWHPAEVDNEARHD